MRHSEKALLRSLGYNIFDESTENWRKRWEAATGNVPLESTSKQVQEAHPSDKRRRNGKWVSGAS